MKNILLAAIAIPFLFGCAGANTSALNQAAYTEKQAWETGKLVAMQDCDRADGDEFIEKSKAVEISKCITRVIQEQVVPHAVFPSLVTEWRQRQEKIAQKYQAGKLTRAQADAQSEESLALLKRQYDAQGAQLYSSAVKADQRNSAAMGAIGATLLQQNGGTESSGQCNAISIPPIAAPGCTNVCINGRWAEAC